MSVKNTCLCRTDTCSGPSRYSTGEKAVVFFNVDDETLTVFIVCIRYAGSDWMSRFEERL